jgi:hypothetical protein
MDIHHAVYLYQQLRKKDGLPADAALLEAALRMAADVGFDPFEGGNKAWAQAEMILEYVAVAAHGDITPAVREALFRWQRLDGASAPHTVSVSEAAAMKGVSAQAVRDVLRDKERRRRIFPGAYHTKPESPRRGEWRIPAEDVRRWQPRQRTHTER